jgi:hypothetical protein
MIAALLLGAVGSWAVVRPRPVDEPLRRVEVTFPELLNARFPALSPGGAYLAAQGRDAGGREGIFVRDMATGRVFYVQGSDVAAWEMRYSPDGTRLAFMRVFNQGVYFLELPDGLPERLTDFGRIAYWEDDETIVMTDDRPGGGDSYRVPIGGGDPAAVRFVEAGREAGFGNILKSGIPGTSRAFGLQTVRINDQGNSNGIYRLFTADLDTGELLVLDSAAVNPEYVRGGYVVYNVGGDEGKLVVRPIDPSTGRFTAQPKDALQGGESAVWGAFNVSDDGDLVYAWGVNPADDYATRLFWIDGPTRRIDSLRVTLQAGLSPSDPILSGDVSTLVFTALRDGDLGGTLHALDLSSGIQTQVTFGGRYAVSAVSEDGSSVYATRIFDDGVSSVPIGVSAVRLRRGAAGSEELLARSAVMPVPSPDGTALLLTNTRDGGPDGFSILSLADGSAVRLDSMRSIGMGFSPDGRYVLGQNVEIGLLTVHSVDGRERYDLPNVVSLHAVWSRDGSHIYYWSIGGSLRRIGVRVEPSFSMVGQAEEVMPVRQSGARSRFDVAPDGSMVVAAGSVGSGRVTEGVPTFVWLQHWAGHVRRQFGRR